MAVVQGDILEDIALIENLEETKRTAVDIAEKVKQAKETEVSIGKAREVYRTVATRGSLVYFLIDTLNALDRCYHYSMANFVYILRKGELPSKVAQLLYVKPVKPNVNICLVSSGQRNVHLRVPYLRLRCYAQLAVSLWKDYSHDRHFLLLMTTAALS